MDDAVTIWQWGIPEEYAPNQLLLQQFRSGIVNYLNTFEEDAGNTANDLPPSINLVNIPAANLPIATMETFEDRLGTLEDHRRKLLRLVQEEGREWPGKKGSK